jgi:GNAT superfamily N-acetyltransferase
MLTVERLGPADVARLRTIRLRALRESPSAFSSRLWDIERWPTARWSQLLCDSQAFVAVRDGADVGMARGSMDPDEPHVSWLESMWVAPEARRTGVGQVLVGAVVDWARAAGATSLRLDVADDNLPAVRFYERLGFEPTGVTGTLPPPRQSILEHQRELRLSGSPGQH